MVGGLSRTVSYGGFHFDIGGHRFFTKVKAVEDMWREVLGSGIPAAPASLTYLLQQEVLLTIRCRPANALLGLGLWNSMLIF